MDNNRISRRQFVAGITASIGAAMTPLGAKALEATASAFKRDTKGILTPTQLDVIKVAADIIIPTTDTPGAAQAGVHHFINGLVTHFLSPNEKTEFIKGVDALADANGGFLSLVPQQQKALLIERDRHRDSDEFYKGLKEAVVFGYYTSEIGASKELNYDPVPGPYHEIPFADVGKVWS